MHFPEHVESFLATVRGRARAIWLIGSRANGTATNSSDWDFVILADEDLINELASFPPPHNIDALVVYDGDTFRCPWPRSSDGWIKGGSLSQWAWTETSPTEAKYIATKEGDDWHVVRWVKGIKVSA